MGYLLCDGFSVNTGYFTAGPLIKGVFSSPRETYDPEKHALLSQFNQGDTLRSELSSVEIEIMGVAETGLNVSQVTDVKTGSVNVLDNLGYVAVDRNKVYTGSTDRELLEGDYWALNATYLFKALIPVLFGNNELIEKEAGETPVQTLSEGSEV